MKRLLAAMIFVAGCGNGGHGVDSLEWTVMGTVAKVSFKADGSGNAPAGQDVRKRICAQVREVYGVVEGKLSIWNPQSEISRYRSIEGVSPEMRPCYEAAFALQAKSGNVFNPFWRGPGKSPDLGGIAKGFAVDLAADKVMECVGSSEAGAVLLDLGGNLKVVSGSWNVGIRNPFGVAGTVRTVTLTNGMACATSGEYERGKHIRDGRTGIPVSNDVASVTVVHPSSAMLADGLSTTLYILGRDNGEEFLKRHFPEARAFWVMSGTAATCREDIPETACIRKPFPKK